MKRVDADSFIIYLVGIVPFSYFYASLKQQFGAVGFVFVAITYLLGLRFLAIWIARKLP